VTLSKRVRRSTNNKAQQKKFKNNLSKIVMLPEKIHAEAIDLDQFYNEAFKLAARLTGLRYKMNYL
jgi:inhibitor of KinA sporulation pathway (predicted exonuclease)